MAEYSSPLDDAIAAKVREANKVGEPVTPADAIAEAKAVRDDATLTNEAKVRRLSPLLQRIESDDAGAVRHATAVVQFEVQRAVGRTTLESALDVKLAEAKQ